MRAWSWYVRGKYGFICGRESENRELARAELELRIRERRAEPLDMEPGLALGITCQGPLG